MFRFSGFCQSALPFEYVGFVHSVRRSTVRMCVPAVVGDVLSGQALTYYDSLRYLLVFEYLYIYIHTHIHAHKYLYTYIYECVRYIHCIYVFTTTCVPGVVGDVLTGKPLTCYDSLR